MKKRHIATSLLTSLLTLTPTISQAEDCCLPEYRAGEPLCDDIACGVYTQYAGVQLNCGWNVFSWGEFLYWRTVLENTWRTIRVDNAIFGQPALGTTQTEIANTLEYRPGFRIGLGMHLPCLDDWLLSADYTWFHHGFSHLDTANAPSFLASTSAAGTLLVAPIYSAIRTKYHLALDIVSLNLQRPNYIGQNVILSPFLGLKWRHGQQKYRQDCTSPLTQVTDNAHATITYDGIGIAAGMDGSWLLCWNLRFIGKADVGILYAYRHQFSQAATFTPFTPAPLFVNVKQHDRHIDLLAKGGLGIGWGRYLCCNRYHVDLAATFDILGDVIKLSFTTGMMEGTSTLLMGLTVRGQFDF
jgi:hypothetical protein